jgi:hypothetical protein
MADRTTTYFKIEPEVAGGLGERTRMDVSTHPPKVFHLHYEFDGWSGDGILESFPCFIVTATKADQLESMDASGFQLRDVEISKSPTFEELFPNLDLPDFRWLDVSGTPGKDDFGIDADGVLVVSDRALAVLEEGGLEDCDIEEYRPSS